MGPTGGLVALASHLHSYFSSPLPALDLPRNASRAFLVFRLERRGHGREQESVWNSRSIIALPTYSRIPVVSCPFVNAARITDAFERLVEIHFIKESSAKGSLVRATTREGARVRCL